MIHPWGPFGLMICYDLRFPELARNLTLRGAKAIIIPAQWPKSRINQWRVLLSARAIENQVFVCGANRNGKDISGSYIGNSMIVDPIGTILAGGEEATEPGILIAELDFAYLEECRETLLHYGQRRSILDEIDDSQI